MAIYDATVAAWDAKYAYSRSRPDELDPSFATAVSNPCEPVLLRASMRSTAGAASAVLAYLLPNDAQLFAALADEAAMSRLLAGVQYRSDVTAGLELGRAVAARVIEWATGRWHGRAMDRKRPGRTRLLAGRHAGRAAGRDLEDLGAGLGRPVPAGAAAGLRFCTRWRPSWAS